MSLASSALATALIFAITASTGDVHTVVARSQLRVQAADYRATGHLVRVDAEGVRTSYVIRLKAHWFPDELLVLLEITSPADARAHVLLQMRPNGQTRIQIAHPGDMTPRILPFDRWSETPIGGPTGGLAGGPHSDAPSALLSYEDFVEPQYFWPNQTLGERTKYGARECDVLKSVPDKLDRTHYAEVRTWLDQTIGYPVYAEKTLKGTNAIKEFTSFGLRQNGGVWSASQVEVKLHGHAGSMLLIIDKGSAKANLQRKDFSSEQLIHF